MRSGRPMWWRRLRLAMAKKTYLCSEHYPVTPAQVIELIR